MNEKKNSDWYSGEGWYEPAPAAVPVKKKKAARGLTPVRLLGLCLLVLLLIAASSLAFSQRREEPEASGEVFDGLPGRVEDFFEDYYDSVTGLAPELKLPRAQLPRDFRLQLQEASGEELGLPELYRQCAPSIVAIKGSAGETGYSWGTGVVIGEDGLILTNSHVIDGCDKAEVICFDDSVYEATLVGADGISDLAVLKIQAKGLMAAQFGQSGQLQVGQRGAAIGNPLGEEFRMTLTDGIVSAIERDVDYNGHSMSLLQTNTAINEGNSGGALFNLQGQVIGITNMKMMSSYSSIEGIGFAIPSAVVQKVVDSLVQHGAVYGRPSIGITVGGIPPQAASAYELPEGLYISAVSQDSDAWRKGIRVGDVLLEVNGIPVTTTAQVNEIKQELQVGDSMEFLIWRDGEAMVFEVVLMDTNDIYK